MSQSDKTETKGDEEMKTCVECKSMTPKNRHLCTDCFEKLLSEKVREE
jgi:RNA polymerase subunit RPABC4/transcription elongation factor Spt4